MREIKNRPINVLLVTSCCFTDAALYILLHNLQVTAKKFFNIESKEFFENKDTMVDFILCAGDLFNEMSLHNIEKIKAALKCSDASTKMIFITSNPRFALSYLIARLCKKQCYNISIDQGVDEILAVLQRIMTSSDVASKPSRNVLLTFREKEVITGLIKQFKPSYLSRRYSINQKTISAHKINALKKLNVERLSEIVSLNKLA